MLPFPDVLVKKMEARSRNNTFRTLSSDTAGLIDFASNDYLGYARDLTNFQEVHDYLCRRDLRTLGSTGSRLITGNSDFHEEVESYIAGFHNAETALLFNSGYDANLGLFSSILLRNSFVLFDEMIHASTRDGIVLGNAKHAKFNHNDLGNLRQKLEIIRSKTKDMPVYIATESIFSMDGDSPDLGSMVDLAEQYSAYLIVDEAHGIGVLGNKGVGLVQQLGLENRIFAR